MTLETLLESEVMILSLLGFIGICYYKTLKYIVMSNCTRINFLCCDIEKGVMSDENVSELIHSPDTETRQIPN